MNELSLQLQKVDKETAIQLKSAFDPFLDMAKEIAANAKEIIVTDAGQIEIIANAREMRLKLQKIRTSAKKEHDRQKEHSKLVGRAIDGLYNMILYCTKPAEEHLQEQEDFAKRQEEKRKAELRDKRTADLEQYEVEAEHYNLADMSEDGFQNLLKASKFAFEETRRAEQKAEKDRIAAEKAEIKRQKERDAEIEKLRKEASERERLAKIVFEKQAKVDAIRKAKEEKERKAQEEKLKKEREAREKIELELKQKQEAEEKARLEKEKAERDAKLAPDKEKLEKLATTITAIEMPEVTSDEARKVLRQVVELLNKTSNFIKEKSVTL